MDVEVLCKNDEFLTTFLRSCKGDPESAFERVINERNHDFL